MFFGLFVFCFCFALGTYRNCMHFMCSIDITVNILKKKNECKILPLFILFFIPVSPPPPLPFSIDQVRRPNMKYLPRPEWVFFLFFTNDLLLWLMWCFVIVLWKISYNNLFREFYFLYHTISYLRVFRSCAEVYPDFSIVAWHGDNRINLCLDIEFDCRLFCEQLVWSARFLFAFGL